MMPVICLVQLLQWATFTDNSLWSMFYFACCRAPWNTWSRENKGWTVGRFSERDGCESRQNGRGAKTTVRTFSCARCILCTISTKVWQFVLSDSSAYYCWMAWMSLYSAQNKPLRLWPRYTRSYNCYLDVCWIQYALLHSWSYHLLLVLKILYTTPNQNYFTIHS